MQFNSFFEAGIDESLNRLWNSEFCFKSYLIYCAFFSKNSIPLLVVPMKGSFSLLHLILTLLFFIFTLLSSSFYLLSFIFSAPPTRMWSLHRCSLRPIIFNGLHSARAIFPLPGKAHDSATPRTCHSYSST